jgi:hypothetical protein
MVFTFVSFKIFVAPVKSIQLFKIDNIISTTDQGTNHRCKLKIELEMFMLFIWWTLQEISNITTTCNALDDGIRVAHEATVAEFCMCAFSSLYCPFIFLLTMFSFFFLFLITIITLHLLHLIAGLMTSSFFGFLFLVTINTLHLLQVLRVHHFAIVPITKT